MQGIYNNIISISMSEVHDSESIELYWVKFACGGDVRACRCVCVCQSEWLYKSFEICEWVCVYVCEY